MLSNSIVIACAAATLASTTSMMVTATLPNRLRALKWSLMVATACLLTMGMTYALTARVRSPGIDFARDGAPSQAWLESVHQAQESTQMIVPCALFVLAMLLVQAASIMTPLRQFITMQDVDLVARDQIALHKASAGKASAKTAARSDS